MDKSIGPHPQAHAHPQALRPSDRQLVAVLSQHGELQRSQLAQLSGLPRSTITDSVARLQRHGIVAERLASDSRNKSGRPPKLLALAAPPGLVGVIALTHESLQAGVLGFDGTLHATKLIVKYQHEPGKDLVDPGLALLDEALRAMPETRPDSGAQVSGAQVSGAQVSGAQVSGLACVVVGLPRPVPHGYSPPTRDTGPSPPTPFAAPWLPPDPSTALADRLGIPVWVENDANLGALGEGVFGAAAKMSSFIYIKIAQGVGAGLVLDRRLHRGANGLAGELAHIHVEDDGAVCRCGGRGCLMTSLNTLRLIDRISDVHPGAISMADVLALAAEGDAGVTRLLRDLGRSLGRSLADFCVFIAPDGIVVDGLLKAASIPVIDGIKEALNQFAPPATVSGVKVVTGTLPDRPELHGGVVLARYNQFGHDLL
ncbi:MAG TPA: ROK family transcriptional regulator [Streptosporangiaceae bacterium]|nr:ROK family transcriptional regulator [Streptosporangiaceae bacterium]